MQRHWIITTAHAATRYSIANVLWGLLFLSLLPFLLFWLGVR